MSASSRLMQVVVMTLAFGIVLILVDRLFNPHINKAQVTAQIGHPQIKIELAHFCCTGCNASVFQAVESFTWLARPTLEEKQLPTQEDNKKKTLAQVASANATYSGGLLAEVKPEEFNQVDFAKLNRAIRDQGLVPTQIAVNGIPKFTLSAHILHVCCPVCQGALEEMAKGTDQNPPRPLLLDGMVPGSMKVNKQNGSDSGGGESGSVTAEFQQHADVTQFMNVLEKNGFAPDSLVIKVSSVQGS